MDQGTFRQEYLQEWPRKTEEEELALQFAKQYHSETEAFDQSVCSGPVVDGSIRPIDNRELALVNRHAIQVRRRIIEEGHRRGVRQGLILQAIRNEA